MIRMKKMLTIICSIALLFSITACQNKDPEEEQAAFDDFMEQQFIDSMQSDYTSAHTYLQDPEKYGIDVNAMEVNLGQRFDEASLQASKEAFKESYAQFQQFDRALLTSKQQDLYDTYAYEAKINEQLLDDKFDYYPQLFESMSGLQFQLPSFFSDWEIEDEKDAQDLILLLKDVKPYVDSALAYSETQKSKGLLMVDADSITEYCKGILDKGTESSILTSMQEKVSKLNLSEEKSRKYQQQLQDAFENSFLTAYQAIYDFMSSLSAEENNEEGLAAFPNGKEYYALLLQQNIGSEKTPADIQKMMEDAFADHLVNLQTIMIADMEGIEPLLNNEIPQTGLTSYEAILEMISEKMGEDFPEVRNLQYHIEDMNKEIASNGIGAYFNIPSIDGDSIQQMRVNPNSADVGSLSTYITVSHEGFPGHMYQYAYLYENMDSAYAKTLSNVSAYVEGYAVYASYQSLKYLEDVNTNLLHAYQENELASYCLYIQADIGIHYKGWSQEQMKDFFSDTGIAMSEEEAALVYDQLQANPAAFEPYYVGYEEFNALQQKAQDELGEAFETKAFHEAILEAGIVPFSVVERHVDAYITEHKA